MLTLNDGRVVVIRSVRPQDAGPMARFVERGLSPASRRRRFHGAIKSLPSALLAALTGADQNDHVALVAEAPEAGAAEEGRMAIVAEARFVTEEPGQPAELALAVADAWQGQGLGAALMDLLCRQGRLRGLPGLQADVMVDNAAMLALLCSRGSIVCRHPEDTALRRIWVPLHRAEQDYPGQPRSTWLSS